MYVLTHLNRLRKQWRPTEIPVSVVISSESPALNEVEWVERSLTVFILIVHEHEQRVTGRQ